MTISSSAEHKPIPLCYGRVRIPGSIMTSPANYHGKMIVAYALCMGPINQVESITIGSTTLTSPWNQVTGLSVEVYLGTQVQGVSPLLAAAFPISGARTIAYDGVAHHGIAYIVLSIDPQCELWGGCPDVQAVIKGFTDIYDPRTASTGYSTNFALQARHFLTSGYLCNISTDYIDDASIQAAANDCDTVIGSEARRWGGIVVQQQQTPRSILNQILAQGKMFDIWSGGTWKIGYYDSTRNPVATIDPSYLANEGKPVPEKTTNRQNHFAVGRFGYLQPEREWEEAYQEYALDDAETGALPWTETVQNSQGIISHGVAARLAEDAVNESQAYRRLDLQLRPWGMALERGDNVLVRNIGLTGNDVNLYTNYDANGRLQGAAKVSDGQLTLTV